LRLIKRFLALAVVALLIVPGGLAVAERAQEGAVIVSLSGGISPRALPRDKPAPAAVHLLGGVETSDGSAIPRVNWIKLELAWRGTLDTRGLEVCPRSRLEGADSRQAIERCPGALVSHGKLFGKVFVPYQQPFGIDANLLAFNGKTSTGRTAVWVHAFTRNPPAAFVLPFHVRRQPGQFRTVLETVITKSVGPWTHFAHFSLTVARQFNYHGKRHSYISSSCPLPSDFSAGFLSFARATYNFQGGEQISTESVRSCRARR
jgi:hypothetical protein